MEIIGYSSVRVKSLSAVLYLKLLKEIGFNNVSYDSASRLCTSIKLKRLSEKAKIYVRLRHRGKYGDLRNDFQKELNLSLLYSDVYEESIKRKREVITEFIAKNDSFVYKYNANQFHQKFILQLASKLELENNSLREILHKADILFTVQKAKLRRCIGNDTDYKEAITRLAKIHLKHLKYAANLGMQDIQG
jgi:hypothetical protein